jgi:hypothetical protein
MGVTMFTRRKSINKRAKFNRPFFETFVQRLKDAGFDKISVILPHNYPSVDPKESCVSVEEYLRRDRNFAAIILQAQSTLNNELMKVLFVNSNARAVFVDDTYPSAASEPPSLFFQSPDPGRAFAVFEYFYEVLSKVTAVGFVFLSITGLISIIFILSEMMVFAKKKIGLIQYIYSASTGWDYLFSILSILILFKYFFEPTGLWIKPKRELRILNMIKMAVRGEYRDNPIVQLFVTIVGGSIVAILMKLFKIL